MRRWMDRCGWKDGWVDGRMDDGYLIVGKWAGIHIWMDGQMDIPGDKHGSWTDELKKKKKEKLISDFP